MTLPNFIKPGDKRGTENLTEPKSAWSGPSVETMIKLALAQPGAKMRRHGVKFQCAGCRAEGHDKSMDNACVFADGRFSCAVGGAAHRAAIAQQLNIPQTIIVKPQPTMDIVVKTRPSLPVRGEIITIRNAPPFSTRRS
jgi:hypothetical protein